MLILSWGCGRVILLIYTSASTGTDTPAGQRLGEKKGSNQQRLSANRRIKPCKRLLGKIADCVCR